MQLRPRQLDSDGSDDQPDYFDRGLLRQRIVPTSVLGVIVFLLAVAPGFYYELERSRQFTRAQESPFYEVSRALVASIGIGTVAGAARSWFGVA
ncbi:DUF6338 family protein [Arthrobacter sp. S2(2024)]|uniref:DUF6338 family protein n=1 Tax=Arthrobacter sp. S2(2024) TaxID=3111911 RepID=UPI003FA5DA4D